MPFVFALADKKACSLSEYINLFILRNYFIKLPEKLLMPTFSLFYTLSHHKPLAPKVTGATEIKDINCTDKIKKNVLRSL